MIEWYKIINTNEFLRCWEKEWGKVKCIFEELNVQSFEWSLRIVEEISLRYYVEYYVERLKRIYLILSVLNCSIDTNLRL